MPYREVPRVLKDKLPKHAQQIFVKVFNNAYEQYKNPAKRRTKESREVVANKAAWAAVKKQYAKGEDGKWHRKEKIV